MALPAVGKPGATLYQAFTSTKKSPKPLTVSLLDTIQATGRKIGKGVVDYSGHIALGIIGLSLIATCLAPLPGWGRGLVLIGGSLGGTGLWLTSVASLERKLGLVED